MSLNIKNPETHALAAKLAKRKGQSMTQVITDALRKELAESEREAEAKRRYEAIMKIAREASALMPPSTEPWEDPCAFLYDPETGLPA